MMKKVLFILCLLVASPSFADNIHNILTVGGQANQCVWDDTNSRLGINVATPLSSLHLNGGVGTYQTGITLGDGDTGIFESSDDTLDIAVGGSGWYRIINSAIYSYSTGGFQINRPDATATTPSYSFNNDGNTGIGTNDIGELSLIAGGVEGIRVNDTEAHSVAGIANYETLVVNDDDIPNKKYVDDILLTTFWDRDGSTLKPTTANDTVDIISTDSQLSLSYMEDTVYTQLYTDSTGNFNIEPTSSDINLFSGNAGVDYGLTFNGESNTGNFKWMEDEDYFQFFNDVKVPALYADQLYIDTNIIGIEDQFQPLTDVPLSAGAVVGTEIGFTNTLAGINAISWSALGLGSGTLDTDTIELQIYGNMQIANGKSIYVDSATDPATITFNNLLQDTIIFENAFLGINNDTPTSAIDADTTLLSAVGDEVAYRLEYTTNKATSGNDTGLVINQTDTLSPGISNLIDTQVGSVSKFSVDNAGSLRNAGAIYQSVTNVNAATYDLLTTDRLLNVSYTATAAVTSLTLPTAQCNGTEDNGRIITIKDAGGGATSNNITIDTEGTETIDGAVDLIINNNYASVELYCYSSNWYIK